jgi:molecular chaperone GrpE
MNDRENEADDLGSAAGEAPSIDGEDEIGPDTEVEILGVVDDDGAVLVDDETYDDESDELRREIADLRDRSMRTLADFDNYRKRAERERGEARRHAIIETVVPFLDVIDNLERALAAGGSADDLKIGVEMILRQFQDLLRRQGVERVAAAGQAFDPTVHEAVSRREDPEVDEPWVAEEMQSGYRLNDRLLRPAMVVVAVPPEDD